MFQFPFPFPINPVLAKVLSILIILLSMASTFIVSVFLIERRKHSSPREKAEATLETKQDPPFAEIDKLLNYIEERYGKYKQNPCVHMIPELYEKCGYYAVTLVHYNKPEEIRLDEGLLRDKESLTHALVHEFFEWRFNERHDKHPHTSAVKATHQYFKHFGFSKFPKKIKVNEKSFKPLPQSKGLLKRIGQDLGETKK